MNSDDNDLFEKMKGGKSNISHKVEKFGFDYYKILDVDKDTTTADIKKKYRKLLAKYHPDKYKNLSEKEKQMKEKQFQLIQMAGKILSDEDTRKIYDLEQKTIKSKNFQSQKNSFEEFIKLQQSGLSEEGKARSQLDFETESKKLNKMMGFDPEKIKEKIDKTTLDKEILDLKARRDMEAIELSQKNLFEGRSFNPSEFNKIFEKNKKKEEKKEKKKQEKGELVKFGEDFTAFNDNGIENFIAIDSNYSSLFGSDNFRENNLYGKVKKEEDFNVSDLSDMSDLSDTDNYKNHNTDRDTKKTNNRLKNIMKEREILDNSLKSMENYKDVMEDQFGISRQFGKMIGRDITQKNKSYKIDSDMVKIYNKMISHESESDSD